MCVALPEGRENGEWLLVASLRSLRQLLRWHFGPLENPNSGQMISCLIWPVLSKSNLEQQKSLFA